MLFRATIGQVIQIGQSGKKQFFATLVVMRGFSKFCQKGSNFDNFFFINFTSLMRGDGIQIPL